MLTIRDAFRLLFPDTSRELSSFSESPVLPADIFAFAAYVLEASGAYHHVVPHTGKQKAERQIVVDANLRARVVSIGGDWRHSAAPSGSLPKVPQHVQELWRRLAAYSREPIFEPLSPLANVPEWWRTMLELLMIADEASRDLGFDIQEIRDLLTLAAHPERPCDQADAIARHHLEQVEQRIAIRQSLRGELKRMVKQCAGGRVATCRVIEVLADHAHCQAEHKGDSDR